MVTCGKITFLLVRIYRTTFEKCIGLRNVYVGLGGVGSGDRIFKDELSYFVGPSAVKLMGVNK